MANAMLELLLVSTFVTLQNPGPTAVRFTRELKIGSIDEPKYSLTYVKDLTVSAQGFIYVAQPQEQSVRVFSPKGLYVRSIGRRGSGPGEFAYVDHVGWRGDTLWVTDASRQRLSIFSKDGKLLRTQRVAGAILPRSSRPTPAEYLLHDGSLLGAQALGPNRNVERHPIIRMNGKGETFATVAHLDSRGSMGVIYTGRSVINFYYPVRADDLWAVAPDGKSIVTVRRRAGSRSKPTFEVAKINISGDTVYRRSFSYVPKPIPQQARDSLGRRASDFFMKARISPAQANRYAKDSLRIPAHQPPVTQVFVARDGRVWLARESIGVKSTQWWVLNQSGQPSLVGSLPVNFRGFHATSQQLWGVETDEWEVPYVTRYRW